MDPGAFSGEILMSDVGAKVDGAIITHQTNAQSLQVAQQINCVDSYYLANNAYPPADPNATAPLGWPPDMPYPSAAWFQANCPS
jgi:hypothetical protein